MCFHLKDKSPEMYSHLEISGLRIYRNFGFGDIASKASYVHIYLLLQSLNVGSYAQHDSV